MDKCMADKDVKISWGRGRWSYAWEEMEVPESDEKDGKMKR